MALLPRMHEKASPSIPTDDTPYEELPSREYTVSPDTRLGDVLQRAEKELYVSGMGGVQSVAFYDDSRPSRVGRPLVFMPLIGGDGLVDHHTAYQDATFEQLIEADEAGALPGDPLRPYLVITAPIGNGGFLLAFAVFAWGAAMVSRVVKRMADHSGDPNYEVVKERMQRAPEVLERVEPTVTRSTPDVREWKRWLHSRDWTADELAPLLGLSVGDAQVLLAAFGFVQDTDGRWHPNGDEPAKVLADLNDMVEWKFGASHDPAFEDVAREQIEELLTSGRAPGPGF